MAPNDTNRRSFLRRVGAVTGAASAMTLAGCSGADGDSGSDGGSSGGSDGSSGGSGSGSGGDTDYPSQQVDSIVPYATGGGFDAYARLSQPYWKEYLDTDVVVKNVVGGGGVTAGTQVMNAKPDGYTKMIWAPGEALPSQIGRDVGYDLREMSHIGFMTQSPSAIVLSESTGIETWSDFVDNIPNLNFATQGVGTMAHVGMDFMAELTGEFSREDINYVHYGGTGEVLSGLKRDEANAFLITAGDSGAKVVQGIEGTKLFMVFSSPDVIDWYFQDAGVEVGYYASDLDVKGLEEMGTVSSMRRFWTGPPGVPEDVLQIQRDAFDQIINDQEFLDKALESQRPVIEPGDHTEVDDVIQKSYDLMTSQPFKGILEDIFAQ